MFGSCPASRVSLRLGVVGVAWLWFRVVYGVTPCWYFSVSICVVVHNVVDCCVVVFIVDVVGGCVVVGVVVVLTLLVVLLSLVLPLLMTHALTTHVVFRCAVWGAHNYLTCDVYHVFAHHALHVCPHHAADSHFTAHGTSRHSLVAHTVIRDLAHTLWHRK